MAAMFPNALHRWSGHESWWVRQWFVSVLADTYGALLLVLLTKWFYEQGSQESQDPGGSDG